MPSISPIFRITFGVLLLTISLLLIGDILGFVPNQEASEINARKSMAESLAVHVSSDIGENRIKSAEDLLSTIVKRNKQIQSVALVSKTGHTIMQSDNHQQYWGDKEGENSTPTHMQVPIYAAQKRWGTLQVKFAPLGSQWSELFAGRSFFTMIVFIVVAGFGLYWLFLRRVLSELDPKSVVPERVRSALDILAEGLVMLDTSERIIFTNNAFKKKSGFLDVELIGKRFSSLPWDMESHTLLSGKEKLPWNMLLETGEIPPVGYLKLKTRTQGTLTFDINTTPIKAPDQKIKGVIVTIDDITELERKNKDLNHLLDRLKKSQEEISRQNVILHELATHDPLTHLLNRRSLLEGMENLLAEARYQNSELSCMMVDIDFFKSVNDNFGHSAGDTVIQTIAEILRSSVRSEDIIGRYGGEEFVIVLPGVDEPSALKIAEKIRLTIANREFDGMLENLKVTSCLGVSSTESGEWVGDKLIDHADQALYIAKQSGRNRVVCYREKQKDQTGMPIQTKDAGKEHTLQTVESKPAVSESVTQVQYTTRSAALSSSTFELTEDLSRTVILDRMNQAQRLAQRNRTNLSVLSIFIDTIQRTNNTMGYAMAEKLKRIAYERLTGIFRSSDSILPEAGTGKSMSLSRSSDSEFTAILSGIDHVEDTTWAIFRMLKELSVPVDIDGNELVMTANIGVGVYPVDGEDAETLLSNSKMALYKAIEKGRGEYLFYNKEMNHLSKLSLKIESQLHQAIEKEELYLNYQPIVNMETGRIEKFEALLRWKHPEFGLVSPATFIEIAEHAGIIKSIGKWVIQRAVRQLKTWHNNGHSHLLMSINLSAVQFHQTHLADDIIEIVDQEGVSPQSIVFELTETVLLKSVDHVRKIIFQLHEAGFGFALDDFGTGYSSLEHLHKFPIQWIKIDKSFMDDFPSDVHAVSIVSGLIGLSHNLGMHVITEGIENESQLLILRNLKCDEAQGYLLSRPLSGTDATIFLDTTGSHRMIRKINASQDVPAKELDSRSVVEILNTPPV